MRNQFLSHQQADEGKYLPIMIYGGFLGYNFK